MFDIDKEGKKRINFIIFILIITILFSISSKIFTFYQMDKLNNITKDIYNHPLKVSNAALKVKSDVYRIHRDMKDLALSRSDEKITSISENIKKHEQTVYEHLNIIENRILGERGLLLLQDTKKLFKDWKPIRDKVISLKRTNRNTKAIEITQQRGARHVLSLENSANKLYNYANNKATSFKLKSDQTMNDLRIADISLSTSLLLILILFAFYVITKMKKYMAEQYELKQSNMKIQERITLILESSTDGIWDWDLLKNKVYFSPRWKEILGYSDSELKNEFSEWENRIHPDDKEQTFLKVKESHEGKGETFRVIHRLKHKDGHWVWIDARGKTLFDDYGQAIRMLGSHTDITQEKKAEKALIESKERYETAEQIGKVGSWEYRVDTNEFWGSKEVNKIYGLDPNSDTFSIELVENCIPQRKRVHQALMDLLEKNKPYNLEFEIHPFDGAPLKNISSVAKVEYDKNNKPIKVIGFIQDITARSLLQKENKKLINVLDKNVNEVHIFNVKDFHYSYVNNAGLSELGYTMEEMKKLTPIDITVEVHNFFQLKSELEPIINGTKKQLFYETRHICKDGSTYPVSVTLQAIELNGEIEIVVFATDISERIEMQNALNESEVKFRLLMEQSPSVIELYDLDGNQIDVNNAYERLWGFPASQTINKFNLFKSEEVKRTGLIEYVKKAYNGEPVSVPVYKYDSRGETEAQGLGRQRYLSTKIYPLKNNDGDIRNIVITHEDVTDRENMFLELKQKKEELETIIQEAPNPIMIHNEDGKVLIINKIWLELTGYNLDEIDTIDKWTKKAYGAKMPIVKKNIDRLYKLNEKIDEGEYSINTSNGDIVSWQFSSAPLGVVDGKRTLISTAMDITELKKKDNMLMSQSRFAAMGEMIGMIAHQWRQPIAGIGMSANNMIMDIELGEFNENSAKEYSYSIVKQTQHLSKTIDDFRNFFKPDKEVLKVNIKDVIYDTLLIVNESLKNNDIKLKINLESNVEIDVYPRELMQVFVNIVTNAKDSLVQSKTENPEIDVRVYEDEKYLNIDICDNGRGIKEDLKDKIFEPYFTTKDESSGTGLGLYMSKMIVEEHLKGVIEVHNRDIGVCFVIRLLK